MMPTNEFTTDEKLVSLIKSRIFEINANIKKCSDADERQVLEDAMTVNCSWLLFMGHSISEIGGLV